MNEIEDLEVMIKSNIYTGDAERELNEISKRLTLLKNIFNVTLTKRDYEYYLGNKDGFNVNMFTSYLKSSFRSDRSYQVVSRSLYIN